YRPQHVLPLLADLISNLPRSAEIGFFATTTALLPSLKPAAPWDLASRSWWQIRNSRPSQERNRNLKRSFWSAQPRSSSSSAPRNREQAPPISTCRFGSARLLRRFTEPWHASGSEQTKAKRRASTSLS